MHLIAERGSRRYCFALLDRAEDFRPPFPDHPYACLLWDATGAADADARDRVARALVESGCVYAVCGGEACEAWHDAVDEALSVLQAEGRVPEERMVVTTWHQGESPREVAEFFVLAAAAPEGEVRHHLLLQVGQDERRGDELRAAVLAALPHLPTASGA